MNALWLIYVSPALAFQELCILSTESIHVARIDFLFNSDFVTEAIYRSDFLMEMQFYFPRRIDREFLFKLYK